MFFVLFDHDMRRLSFGERSGQSKYGHTFGTLVDYSGLKVGRGKPPVHVLFRINLKDPCVSLKLGTISWLPLLCAIRYGACHLGYRVDSDDSVTILHQADRQLWDGFPSADYPTILPVEPVAFRRRKYRATDPQDVYVWAGVFGYEHVSQRQFGRVVNWAQEVGVVDETDLSEGETIESFLRESECPFVQGRPVEACPNPDCPNSRRKQSLKTLAVFSQELDPIERRRGKVKSLWGDNCEDLQIIYQICPKCSAISTTNQCT